MQRSSYPTDKRLQLTDSSPIRKRSLPDRQKPALDVLTGLTGADKRGFGLKLTQFSHAAHTFAPHKRPKNMPVPEEGHLRSAEVMHIGIQRALSDLRVQRTLLSAERSSRQQMTSSVDERCSNERTLEAEVHLPIPEDFTGLSEDHFLWRLMKIEVPFESERKAILGLGSSQVNGGPSQTHEGSFETSRWCSESDLKSVSA